MKMTVALLVAVLLAFVGPQYSLSAGLKDKIIDGVLKGEKKVDSYREKDFTVTIEVTNPCKITVEIAVAKPYFKDQERPKALMLGSVKPGETRRFTATVRTTPMLKNVRVSGDYRDRLGGNHGAGGVDFDITQTNQVVFAIPKENCPTD